MIEIERVAGLANQETSTRARKIRGPRPTAPVDRYSFGAGGSFADDERRGAQPAIDCLPATSIVRVTPGAVPPNAEVDRVTESVAMPNGALRGLGAPQPASHEPFRRGMSVTREAVTGADGKGMEVRRVGTNLAPVREMGPDMRQNPLAPDRTPLNHSGGARITYSDTHAPDDRLRVRRGEVARPEPSISRAAVNTLGRSGHWGGGGGHGGGGHRWGGRGGRGHWGGRPWRGSRHWGRGWGGRGRLFFAPIDYYARGSCVLQEIEPGLWACDDALYFDPAQFLVYEGQLWRRVGGTAASPTIMPVVFSGAYESLNGMLGDTPADDAVQQGATVIAEGVSTAIVVAGVLAVAAVGGLWWWYNHQEEETV